MGCSFSSFEPDRISMRMKWGNDYGHTKGADIAWQHAASASLSYSNIHYLTVFVGRGPGSGVTELQLGLYHLWA